MHERRRRGQSTIIGALFFVLIAFLVLSTSVLTFNSFNGYSGKLKASDQQDVQRKETSLSIPALVFGGSVSHPVTGQEFGSLPNTGDLPLFPLGNMNFTQNMDGWYFTRAYTVLSSDQAAVTNSPLYATSQTAFTLKVSNSRQSQNDIAQVALAVNGTFTVPAAQTAPQGWSVSVAGNTVTWTANTKDNNYKPNDIDGGDSQTFTWVGVPPAAPGDYPHTVAVSWVSGNRPPFVDGGSGTIETIVGAGSGSSSATIAATYVQRAGGANGGYDPTTPIGSESGPGSLYVFFQPTLGGSAITKNQELGAVMNFTTSFVLDGPTASSVLSARLSFGFSLDSLVCRDHENQKCSVTTSVYLLQESTGDLFLLDQVDPTQVAHGNPTGWVFETSVSFPPGISWTAGKYDLVLSTSSTLTGSQPGGDNNYPATLQMHFDDVGVSLVLKSSTYYVDSWAQSSSFVIRTGVDPLNITGVDLDVALSTTASGPVSAYVYMNDFSRGTIASPFWVLFNSTTFSTTADLEMNAPAPQGRLYVDARGDVLVRVYAVSVDPFQLTASISMVVNTNIRTMASMTVTNASPFAVHLVSLYVSGQNGLLHLDVNSSAPGVSGPFDYWVNPGQTLTIQIPLTWVPGQQYTVTLVASNGVQVSGVFQS